MKFFLITMLVSSLYGQEILNIDNELKAECKIEIENPLTSTANSKIQFEYSKVVKIGDWMFEEGHYTKTTSTVLTEGYIIKNEEELKNIIEKDENFFMFSPPKNFSVYKKRELEHPHIMNYFLNLSIDNENIKVNVNKKVNVHNMIIGLVLPHDIKPETKTISLDRKEVINGITIECKSINKLSKKEKKQVLKEVKRLAKNIDDSSRYSQKDLIKKVLNTKKVNKTKEN